MSNLFEPFTLKNLEIRNRIGMPPMVCFGFADEEGYVSQMNIAHYRAIAAGGTGLIIQEATCISPAGRLAENQLGIWEDDQILGLSHLVEAVHKEGAKIFAQIHHAGLLSVVEPLDAPSDRTLSNPDGTSRVAHELSLEKIDLIKKQFVAACLRAKQAGYDGVELHGCHSYLICQFLNNRINKRTDQYGEPTRFAVEIVEAVRAAVGEDYIVGIRLGGFEPTLADGITNAQALKQAGIDFLDISYGFGKFVDAERPEGYPLLGIVYAAQEIKKATGLPVFAANEINTPELAQLALDTAGVDLVHVGRGTLVDYSFANDAKAGRSTGRCLNCQPCKWRSDHTKCPGRINYLREKNV